MRSLALALLVTGCASIPPAHLTAAKNAVHSQYTYQYRLTNVQEELSRPEDGTANCTKFTLEYQELVGGERVVCTLPDGDRHRVLDVDGWRLDNRERSVIPVTLSDCR